MSKISESVVVLLITILLIYSAIDFAPKDSTDPEGGRSGIGLYVDNKTGCHYLGGLLGPNIKRINKNGEHICIGEESELHN